MSIPPEQQTTYPSNETLLVEALWPDEKAGSEQNEDFAAEMAPTMGVLSLQIKPWPQHMPPAGLHLLKEIEPTPAMTFDDLTKEIVKVYQAEQPGEELASKVIHDIVRRLVRCWTMTTLHLGSSRSRSAVRWEGKQTLESVIEAQLEPLEKASEACAPRSLDKDLTAVNLVKYQDVRIRWSFDITEHLNLTSENGVYTLFVFEHKIWVKNNREWPDRCPVPQDVLDELMLTLNVLFPNSDPRTMRLLKSFDKARSHDMGNCGVEKTYNLGDFRYWRARMAELDILLNAQQRGFRQVYRLDKNKQNLMGVVLFWVSGVAVLVLTIIGSVSGIMSLQVSQAAYRLAVAQACADADVKDGLPQYCV
ncbi:hypothetical protein B0T11DRAFT_137303 [Plectosphaerella cucumerina]|uniref:Uncharacterized protein n=1 Tax=Plectosphaerella cucumerina TaxID=40658 RepID=A0A8K0T8Q1_9PEZI|nr:hypothetical protein B0T11DRAFT_137303 [Plectosphaerella cucumerina]